MAKLETDSVFSFSCVQQDVLEESNKNGQLPRTCKKIKKKTDFEPNFWNESEFDIITKKYKPDFDSKFYTEGSFLKNKVFQLV